MRKCSEWEGFCVWERKDQNEDVNLANDKTTLKFNVLNNNGGIGLIRVYQEGKYKCRARERGNQLH